MLALPLGPGPGLSHRRFLRDKDTGSIFVLTLGLCPVPDSGLLEPLSSRGDRSVFCPVRGPRVARGWGWAPGRPGHHQKLGILSPPPSPGKGEGRKKELVSHHVYVMKSSHKPPKYGVRRASRHVGTSLYREGDTPIPRGRELLLGTLADQVPAHLAVRLCPVLQPVITG